MHFHRLEKWWLTFGITMLIVFLAVVGVSAFAMGMQPPGGHQHTLDPAKVQQTPPFDKPGLKQTGTNQYDAYLIAFAFGYSSDKLEIPVGAKVHFYLTSKDVVHGFNIIGTNVNMMAVPGEINDTTYTFSKPGDYLVVCNEYCGIAHEMMKMEIIVK